MFEGRLFTVVAALSLWAVPASASAGNVAATGMATASVVQPIAIVSLSDLDFGIVTGHGPGGGRLVLGVEGGADYRGAVRSGCSAGMPCPEPHAARFKVIGEPGRAYTIGAPTSVMITGKPVGQEQPASLRVEDIRFRTLSRPDMGAAGQLDASGVDSFGIGGTLLVPDVTPPARYRATMPVVVAYS